MLALPAPIAAQLATQTTNLSVRVTDFASEAPLDRVRLDLLKFPDGILQVTFSDGGGHAESSTLIIQSYSIRATRDGYLSAEVAFDIRRGEFSKSVAIQLRPETPPWPAAPSGVVSSRLLATPKEAREEFTKGLKLLNEKKDARGSVPLLQHAIELAPQFYDAHVVLGLAHLQMQALEEAEKCFTRAMELEPKLMQPYHPLATILITQKRYGEAEKVLQRAQEIDPRGWQWPFELARSQAMQRNWEKAIAHGKQALAANNVPSKIHLLMADIYSNAGQVELAAAELDAFEKLDPQSPYMPKVRAAREQLKKPQN
ncbi:MAG: tetratricopeptide repeat protein [Acidobacteria bacterium]|nr:tetratricopeptide repeat protein [Acidobacteriota bacterium]